MLAKYLLDLDDLGRVLISTVPRGECLEWGLLKDKDGYGKITINKSSQRTHRIVYRGVYGDPGKLFVCHRCDNPSCVRPEHLFLGDASENTWDMMSKNRSFYSRRKACSAGHRYTKDSVWLTKAGHRQCKICRRIRTGVLNARKRARSLEASSKRSAGVSQSGPSSAIF